MKEVKKVYGQFELLKKGEHGLSKVTYSSLEKYSRSPYLHSNSPFMQRSPSSQTSATRTARIPHLIELPSPPPTPLCIPGPLHISSCLN